jgi:hypothetical protein
VDVYLHLDGNLPVCRLRRVQITAEELKVDLAALLYMRKFATNTRKVKLFCMARCVFTGVNANIRTIGKAAAA